MTTGETMQLREDARTSVLLTAIADSGKLATRVKIRNMSPKGSMLEANSSFSEGESVLLTRGELVTEGRIVWSAGTKCGVQFNRPTSVRQWFRENTAIPAAGT